MTQGGDGFDYAFERLDGGVRAVPAEGAAVVLADDWTGADPLDGGWTRAIESVIVALLRERAPLERRGDALVVSADDAAHGVAESVVDDGERARALIAHLVDEGVLGVDGSAVTLARADEETPRNAYCWGALCGAAGAELGERAEWVRDVVAKIETEPADVEADFDAELEDVAREITALVGDRELDDDLSALDPDERERFKELQRRFYHLEEMRKASRQETVVAPIRPLERLSRALDVTAARLTARGDRLRRADENAGRVPREAAVDAAVALVADLRGAATTGPDDAVRETDRLHRLVGAGTRLVVG